MPIPLIALAAGAGLSALASFLQSRQASNASDAQAAAGVYAADQDAQARREALALQLGIFEQQQEDQAPWLEAGRGGLTRLRELLQPGGSLDQDFDPGPRFDPSQVRMDPGFEFRQREAQRAIERAASARGGALSPSTMREVARYTSDLASNEYGAAYGRAASEYDRDFTNRYNTHQTNRGNRFNSLAALSGVGQTAVNQLSQAAQNYGNQGANIISDSGARQADLATQVGNARASGYTNTANAIGAGASNFSRLLGNLYGGR